MWQQGLWQKGLWHDQLHALLLTVQPLMLMACVGSYFPYPTFLIYFLFFKSGQIKPLQYILDFFIHRSCRLVETFYQSQAEEWV